MYLKDEFAVAEVEQARAIVRAQPFATIVTANMAATHMPCLVDEDDAGLAILGHVARGEAVAGQASRGARPGPARLRHARALRQLAAGGGDARLGA